MSEADYLLIFNEYNNTMINFFSVYLSIVTAFLIVTYLVGAKLEKVVAVILVFLYCLASFWLILAVIAHFMTMTAHVHNMREAINQGIDFSYHFAAGRQGMETLFAILVIATPIAGYLVSLYFFYYTRKKVTHND